MARIAPLLLFVLMLTGCYERTSPPPVNTPRDDKVKVKVVAPGVNVELEGKKSQ
jgi:hypothetical protein